MEGLVHLGGDVDEFVSEGALMQRLLRKSLLSTCALMLGAHGAGYACATWLLWLGVEG